MAKLDRHEELSSNYLFFVAKTENQISQRSLGMVDPFQELEKLSKACFTGAPGLDDGLPGAITEATWSDNVGLSERINRFGNTRVDQ